MPDPLPMTAAVTTGVLLGTVSGLIPGLHVNNFAFIIAGIATALTSYISITYLGLIMVTAAVTHSFLDAIPSMVLGVPDESMALVALPGHRLVLEGKGEEAIALSAMGSLTSVSLSLVFAAPLTLAMIHIYPVLEGYMEWVLIAVFLFLLATEKGGEVGAPSLARGVYEAVWVRAMAVIVFAASGFLGFIAWEFDGEVNALVGGGSLLMPLFMGLFGVPVLLLSAKQNSEIPSQNKTEIGLSKFDVLRDSFSGGLAGAIVGWFPGLSAAAATSIIQSVYPESESSDRSMRGFIVAVSGVDTSNAIFALFALFYIKRARSGVMVAFQSLEVEMNFELLLWYVVGVVAASIIAYAATLYLSDKVFLFLASLNYRLISTALLVFLALLTFAFSGWLGLPLLVASSLVGMIPNVTMVRRVNCMGCLLLPLIHFYAFQI